jgi:hypothetical protein
MTSELQMNSVAAYLGQSARTYPIIQGNQELIPGRSFGACCDPLFADAPSALMVERWSSIRLLFRKVNVAGDLQLVPNVGGQFPSFFAVGQSDPGAAAGIWEQSNITQSNLYAGGAPVDRGQLFLCFGHSVESVGLVERLSPALLPVPPAVASPADGVGSLFASLSGSGSYEIRIMKAVMERVSLTAVFGGGSNFTYVLGNLSDAPSMSQGFGPETTSFGQPIMNCFKPYMAVLMVNARDESRKLTVTTGVPTPIVISADPGNILPGPFGAAGAEFHLEVKMRMYGIPVCATDSLLCSTASGPVAPDATALRAAIYAELRAMQAGQIGQGPGK